MDPRYRFALVVSFLMIAWWCYVVVSTYLFGERGLNVDRYTAGVMWVGLSALAGFSLVWAAHQVTLWQRRRKTGFEAEVRDEFGTVFEMAGSDGHPIPFKLSLSKFLPQLVAPPAWAGLSALEAELMGFLNAYRSWPLDLKNHDASLYEKAFARWQVMRHLPGTGPWHRVMALAKDLGYVHAYREIRKVHPPHHFWKRDEVKYVQRCQPTGGMSAFVLSTMPAFRSLGSTAEGLDVQRSLLTALRYHQTPAMVPINGGSMTRELVDYLWRAEAQLRQLDVDTLDEMTPELFEDLRERVTKQWLTVLADVKAVGEPQVNLAAFKQADLTVWLRQGVILSRLGPLLPPEMRQLLNLWEVDGGLHHPAWAHLAPILQDAGLISNTHDGVAAVNGCFTLRVGDATIGPVVKLVLDPSRHLPALQQWQGVEGYKGPVDVVLDMDQLTAVSTSQAYAFDAKLAEILG